MIRSLLFAAGKGTRMRPLSDIVPKPALPLLDVPLAAYALRRLVDRWAPVAVNVSHLAEEMMRRIGPHVGDSAMEIIDEQPEPYGGGGTLAALRARLHDPVLTYNADVLTDVDLGGLIDAHGAAGDDVDATIAIRHVEHDADFEISSTGALRLVPRAGNHATPGALFLGIAVLGRAALDLIPETRPVGLAETVLGPLARRGRLGVHVHDGYWRDVGTPAAYLDASLDVLEGRAPEWPGGFPGEVRQVYGGHAYVGRGCDVAEASLGPGAIVLEGAALGAGARAENAIVLPGERVPAGERLHRCVWARGSRIDAPEN